MVALSWRWSDFVVRPIKGAVIGSGYLLRYEGQPRLPGPAGVDHALRYNQQQIASPSDQHVCVVSVVPVLGRTFTRSPFEQC
jgi:hypothetical protein